MQKLIFLAIAIAIATVALAPLANNVLAQNASGAGSASAIGGNGGNGGSSAINAQGGNGGSATAVGSGSGGSGSGTGVGSSSALGGSGGNGGTCTDQGTLGCSAQGGNGGSASAGAIGSSSGTGSGSVTTTTGTGSGTSGSGSVTTGSTTTGTTTTTSGGTVVHHFPGTSSTTTTTTTTNGGHFFNHFGGHFLGLTGHFNFGGSGFLRGHFNQNLLTQYTEQYGISSGTVVILSTDPGQVLFSANGQQFVNPCPASAPVFLSNGVCAVQQEVQQQTVIIQSAPVQQTILPPVVQAPQCVCGQDLINLQNQLNSLQAQLSQQGHFGGLQGVFNHIHGFFHPGTHSSTTVTTNNGN